jgi:LysR family transcriptional regulator, glycine cleavage system transcriptional activator
MSLPLRKLPLSGLRAFEAAARHLSFAAAAHELGVTPAAISYQIKTLEDRIGRQLFLRRNRAVSLSSAGEKLAAPLTDLFSQIARLMAEISMRGGVATLEVTAMPSFAAKWLAPRLARFGMAHPECRIRVVASDELAGFDHTSSDVGLRYGPGGYKGLHAEKLMDVTAFPVCSRAFMQAHAKRWRSPADLALAPLLHDETSLIRPGLPNWRLWFESVGVRNPDANRGPVFDSAHLAIEAALAGQGVALALGPLVQHDLKTRRLVRLFEAELPSPFSFWFVCRPSRMKDPRVAQFRDWLYGEI